MLKLLSYNVLEGALPDRLRKVLRVIRHAEADVVAIQEARHWRRERRQVLRQVARELGMRGLLFRANSGFDLAVFSRLPILSHTNLGADTIFLHTTGRVDVKAPSGETLTIFVTHLRPDHPSRQRELALLLRWMRPYRGRLCAMCGDLNSLTAGDHVARRLIWRDSELGRGPRGIIAAIERAGWVDCFRERNPSAPGLTLGAGRRAARVDYIFASKPLTKTLTASKVTRHPELLAASDHSPVWAKFDI
ncbi:MAG TPA: endonuclease/exonuclease/phosphatase family protein [Armatimonadota bacterium]|nr:endonuclease/exonuclease/phosphatase family protein [Armatimonadota bacterium]